jgi:hypothetical protein
MDAILFWCGVGLLFSGILIGYPLGSYMEQRDRRRRDDVLGAEYLFEKKEQRHAN